MVSILKIYDEYHRNHMRKPRRQGRGADGHPAFRGRKAGRTGPLPVPGRPGQQPHQGVVLQNIYPGERPLRGHHLLLRHPRLPADVVVHPAKGRTRPLSGQDAPHPPFDGTERLLLRGRRHRRVLTRTGRGTRRAHALPGGARPADQPHEDPHERSPRPLCGPGAHRQDRPAGHPPAALQRPLYARRHRRLFLRRAGALNGLHRPVRHRTLLQRVLPRPAAAHGARPAQHERRAGKDVRHLPGIPVLGADHGRAHRGRRQLQGARGRRGRDDQTGRGIPRTQVRVGRRHDLRRQHLARRAHGAHLGPLVERQDHLGQTAGHPARRAGAAPGIDLARRLLRRPRKRPRATPTAITTTRHSKPSTSACSTTTSAA